MPKIKLKSKLKLKLKFKFELKLKFKSKFKSDFTFSFLLFVESVTLRSCDGIRTIWPSVVQFPLSFCGAGLFRGCTRRRRPSLTSESRARQDGAGGEELHRAVRHGEDQQRAAGGHHERSGERRCPPEGQRHQADHPHDAERRAAAAGAHERHPLLHQHRRSCAEETAHGVLGGGAQARAGQEAAAGDDPRVQRAAQRPHAPQRVHPGLHAALPLQAEGGGDPRAARPQRQGQSGAPAQLRAQERGAGHLPHPPLRRGAPRARRAGADQPLHRGRDGRGMPPECLPFPVQRSRDPGAGFPGAQHGRHRALRRRLRPPRARAHSPGVPGRPQPEGPLRALPLQHDECAVARRGVRSGLDAGVPHDGPDGRARRRVDLCRAGVQPGGQQRQAHHLGAPQRPEAEPLQGAAGSPHGHPARPELAQPRDLRKDLGGGDGPRHPSQHPRGRHAAQEGSPAHAGERHGQGRRVPESAHPLDPPVCDALPGRGGGRRPYAHGVPGHGRGAGCGAVRARHRGAVSGPAAQPAPEAHGLAGAHHGAERSLRGALDPRAVCADCRRGRRGLRMHHGGHR
eukprot:scaffold4754_cov218-Pinguiococcus_pyrenoidosus.AAC.1